MYVTARSGVPDLFCKKANREFGTEPLFSRLPPEIAWTAIGSTQSVYLDKHIINKAVTTPSGKLMNCTGRPTDKLIGSCTIDDIPKLTLTHADIHELTQAIRELTAQTNKHKDSDNAAISGQNRYMKMMGWVTLSTAALALWQSVLSVDSTLAPIFKGVICVLSVMLIYLTVAQRRQI